MAPRSVWRPLCIMLAVYLMADAAACFQDRGSVHLTISRAVLLGLLHSQVDLAAIWLAVGEAGSAGRLLTCGFVLLVPAILFDDGSFLLLSCWQMFSIWFPLFTARSYGMRIVQLSERAENTELAPMQFQLRQLFLGITVVGVLLGLIPVLIQQDIPPGAGIFLMGAIGLVTVWAVFASGMAALRIGAPIATAFVVGVSIASATGANDHIFIIGSMLLQMLLVAAPLGLFRWYGYRLEWSARSEA